MSHSIVIEYLKNRYKKSIFRKLVNFLKYIKQLLLLIYFFSERKEYRKISSEKNINTWSNEIIKDLKDNQNWRKNRKSLGEIIDFNAFKEIFKILSNHYITILEIGSYDGFFINKYKNFKKIILSDLTEHSNLYPDNKKFEFIKLNGKNLNDIPSSCTDVIFSIDTFLRINKNTLKNYFENMPRIITPDGIIIIHIPDSLNRFSLSMNYTFVSRVFFKNILKEYFTDFYYTTDLYRLSTFLIAKRNNKIYIENKI